MQVLPYGALALSSVALVVALLIANTRQTQHSVSMGRDTPSGSALAFSACNVSHPSCQAALMRAVASQFVTAASLRKPEIRFISATELARLNRSDVEAQLVSRQVRNAMIALRLLASEGEALSSLVPSEQAVYRSRTHDVLIAFPASEHSSLRANVALAHELVHAVQAQRGLFDRPRRSFDQSLAWRARLEGEAVARSYRVKSRLEGLDPDAIEWKSMFEQWSQASLASIQRARAPLALAVATLPYARGAWWYESRSNSAGFGWPEHFATLLDDPAAGDDAPPPPQLTRASCAGESEELGALSLLAFVLPEADRAEASAVAQRLRSDRLCVRADGHFTWQLVWSPEGSNNAPLVQRRAERLGLRAQIEPSDSAETAPRLTITGDSRSREEGSLVAARRP